MQKDETFTLRNEQVKANCIEFISKLPAEPVMQVIIKPYVKKRSIDSNSLYWKWLEVFSEYTGYSKDDMHDVFRARFLPVIERTVKGIELRELTSTTSLNTKQFSEYMKEIEILAVEMGIVLPYPDELIYTLE